MLQYFNKSKSIICLNTPSKNKEVYFHNFKFVGKKQGNMRKKIWAPTMMLAFLLLVLVKEEAKNVMSSVEI